MKLIAILFLCSRLLTSFAQEDQPQEIDCNDEDVFKAVDTALKKYNNGSNSGNQFVLYRINQVISTGDRNIFYSVKYEIKEGDCPVQSGKTWQDCDYKEAEQAATGECMATIGKRPNMEFSVTTQTCHITPAKGPVVTSQYDCYGCLYTIGTVPADFDPVLRHGIEHFNNHTGHSHLFALKEVKRAQRQVVSGWNYEVTYLIQQTDCSKENFKFLTEDCKPLSNGNTGECTDHAYMDPQLRIASFSQKCQILPEEDFLSLPRRRCVGCPSEIPVDSPDMKKALNHSITKLNAENNATFYFKIDIVHRATSQVVAGSRYFIDFTARETTCSKESNKELTESCEINKLGEILRCTADVYVVPWENKIYPTVKCQSVGKTSLLKRPPGFSPFRSVQAAETKEGTTVSLPHTSMASVQEEEQDSDNEQRPTRDHGWGHEKQIKHGHGHGHKHEHDQSDGHQKGHDHGHGHQREHGLAHRHKHEHGHGHEKHNNKGKQNGKHNDWRTSSSEDSTTSAQTPEKTEGPKSLPSLAPSGVEVAFPEFRDSDLIAAMMTNTAPTPTENDDSWIPEIQVEPNSLSFNLIPDFPETTSPKCPGRPWKPVNGMNPTVETKEFHDFDLSDAFY